MSDDLHERFVMGLLGDAPTEANVRAGKSGHRFYCYGSHPGCMCAWRNEDRCPVDGTPKPPALLGGRAQQETER